MGRWWLCCLVIGCGGESPPPEIPYDNLSQYNLFVGNPADQKPASNVVPYDVVSVLYADGAGKYRFLAVPPNQKIHFDPSGRWTFPDGTIVIKTFNYGQKLLETRLLINQGGTWSAHTYIWNDAQTDAVRYAAGKSIQLDMLDYQVPNSSQCKNCHGQNKLIVPLGPRTRQLNRDYDYGNGPENQISHLFKLGLLDADPGPPAMLPALADPHGTATVEERARAYLDANCAHCHNESGYASSTALRLEAETTLPIDLGVCRHPVAAGMASGGFLYDVVPGKPDQSIMVFRMKSNDPQYKMPQLPLTTVDQFGVDLISQWIAGRTDPACQ